MRITKPQAEDSPNTRTNVAASSFFLTPLNYFDADVSIDSANAVLLDVSTDPKAPYTVEEYGVEQIHCMPDAVKPFEHIGIIAYALDGREPDNTELTPDEEAASTEGLRHGEELRRVDDTEQQT